MGTQDEKRFIFYFGKGLERIKGKIDMKPETEKL